MKYAKKSRGERVVDLMYATVYVLFTVSIAGALAASAYSWVMS